MNGASSMPLIDTISGPSQRPLLRFPTMTSTPFGCMTRRIAENGWLPTESMIRS